MTDNRHPDVPEEVLIPMAQQILPTALLLELRKALDAAYREGWVLVPRDAIDDPWVPWDTNTRVPDGALIRDEYRAGDYGLTIRQYVHRDDLPDPDDALIDKMARAAYEASLKVAPWDSASGTLRGRYLDEARAALAAYREATQ
jgi:hypothetical protein